MQTTAPPSEVALALQYDDAGDESSHPEWQHDLESIHCIRLELLRPLTWLRCRGLGTAGHRSRWPR